MSGAGDKRRDRGIWQTPHGFRVMLRINGVRHTKRFPATWTLTALRIWRDEHERLHRRRRSTRGTFTEDAEAYMNTITAMPSYTDRKRDIERWVEIFGLLPRWRVTAAAIRTQLHTWRQQYAASTCNHRRTALGHLYTVLDGKSTPNPVREIPPFPEPPATARGVDIAIALAAIRRVHGRKTRVRLLCLLWTGMRPSELMRVTPDGLDLERGICEVLTTKRGRVRLIPLNKSARKAFRRFVRLTAWGKFSTSTVRKRLVAACKAEPPLPRLRLYDLRHTYASALRRAGADLADIGEQLGHTSPRMTKRYAPVVLEKLRIVGELTRKVPSAVPRKKRKAVSA